MPTRYRGTESETRALDTYVKFIRAAESVTARLVGEIAEETGLTVSQFGVLECLLHLGPLCQRDIARKQLKSGGNTTLVIDNLEKRGLVRRNRSEEDRRQVIVSLTKAGSNLISDYFPRHARSIEREMSILSSHEQTQLGILSRKVGLQSAE